MDGPHMRALHPGDLATGVRSVELHRLLPDLTDAMLSLCFRGSSMDIAVCSQADRNRFATGSRPHHVHSISIEGPEDDHTYDRTYVCTYDCTYDWPSD